MEAHTNRKLQPGFKGLLRYERGPFDDAMMKSLASAGRRRAARVACGDG